MSTFELTPEEMELFLTESAEQVDTMEELLVALEKGADPDAVAAIFRAAHTLKGGAATAGMQATTRLTHALESLLDQVREGRRTADGDTVDALLEAVDLLRRCLAAIEQDGTDAAVDVEPLTVRLEALGSDDAGPRSHPEAGVAGGPTTMDPGMEQLAYDAAAVGERVYRLRVIVDDDAPMPSIRLYQTLMILEEVGRLVDLVPSREQIEDPASEHHEMHAVVVTGRTADEIRAALAEVSHLKHVECTEVPVNADASVSDAPVNADASVSDAPVAPAGATDAGSSAEADGEAARRDVSDKPTSGGAPVGAAMTAPHVADTVRVSVRVLDQLMNLVGELVIDRTRLARLGQIDMPGAELREELSLVAGHLSRITTDLQDTIMTARMVPLETLFRRFPRMARDLARRLNKQVRFELAGEDTELDRAVIEHIGDPLVHLIRNAIDHGLEGPAERREAGKSPEGTVRLAAYHQENHIYIEVSDDGRGIDPEQVKRAALNKGLITEEQAQQLHRDEALDLLFMAGFSTTGAVTDVSGRGVGLDVVRRNIERVNGSVSVESQRGEGTRWTIRLPLTLAIVQAMLVRVRETIFAVPLDTVDEIILAGGENLSMANGWAMVSVREMVIPLINPGDVWGDMFRASWNDDAPNAVVVLKSAAGPLALSVDGLIGEQEIVIKNIDGLGGDIAGVSGASILGDGSVALIFDVTGFTKEVRRLDNSIGRHGRRHGRSA